MSKPDLKHLYPGVIHADASYELDDFKARTKISAAELDKAEQAGLRITRVGRKKHIIGADWHKYLRGKES